MMNALLPALLLLISATTLIAQTERPYTPIQIPTRDGKMLAADLYASNATTPKPVILIQTPYNKFFYRLSVGIPSQAGGASFPYDSANYNYVTLDWRGFYGSKDAAVTGYDRGLDGYDAVEWIATQPWCNGKVGTWGPSALGAIQFMTAKHHPPHLLCAVPLVKDFKTKYGDFYEGGVYRKEHSETLEKLGFTPTSLILAHPTNDLTWSAAERSSDEPDSFTVPMLLVSGWFDHFPDDILRAFADLRQRGAPAVRNAHRLIMGPWTHDGVDKSEQGILIFPDATGVANAAALRFFDHYLRGIENGQTASPPVSYYQMGENKWHAIESWQGLAQSADTVQLFFHPDQTLRPDPPSSGGGNTASSSFGYNPRDPSPTWGGARLLLPGVQGLKGPQDQRPVELRGDALTFSTPTLERDLEVTGAITLQAYVVADRTDTDLAIRLTDVYPDGRSVLLVQTIRRMRFRDGYRPADTSAIKPGQVYPVTVQLQNLATTFLKGHQLRVVITGSNFPRYDLNPNTGGPLYQPGDTLVAEISVGHHPTTPSSLKIPGRMLASGVGAEPAAADRGNEMVVFPNPAASKASVSFALTHRDRVKLMLVDAAGKTQATMIDKEMEAGEHRQELNTEGLPSGSWYCVLVVGGQYTVRQLAVE
ncbi:MAG: CocE/NonD family hydrolase [Chlorobi bacterium CHB2]|nr:CocE/NonD family hydrolase [Chlorobi bacterium CHB2]